MIWKKSQNIWRLGYLMEEHGFVHKSVLLYETVGSLNIKPGGIYVDGTLGGGGHAYEVCKRLGSGRLIGIDQDADALRRRDAVWLHLRTRLPLSGAITAAWLMF